MVVYDDESSFSLRQRIHTFIRDIGEFLTRDGLKDKLLLRIDTFLS